ncbi:hypothetical protein FGO68_gene11173 [Halteria grandinella]|uniref:Uncharacterized protein n=1 Tax=Halteria grandinella TaxID=5974 RepID=A0A8J8NGP8_HALGN|nr:hypothetical protein FGO68_gene11173 [Halteria grandinella]
MDQIILLIRACPESKLKSALINEYVDIQLIGIIDQYTDHKSASHAMHSRMPKYLCLSFQTSIGVYLIEANNYKRKQKLSTINLQ